MVFITKHDKEEDFQYIGQCVPPLQLDAAVANTMLDHLCALHVGSRASIVRLSGIICMIGIASRETETIEEMIESGMNIALLNLSYGTHKYHSQVLKNIRTAIANYNKKIGMTCPLGTAVLTKGPIIRIVFPFGGKSNEMIVYKDDTVKICGLKYFDIEADRKKVLYVNYDNIHTVVQVGNEISVNRRQVVFNCTAIEDTAVVCKVVRPGEVRSHQRVHLPAVPVDLPAVSEKDITDLHFAVENHIDIIFCAYIRNGAAIDKIRETLGPEGKDIMIIAQIENQQGVDNIDEIIEAADGICISRIDLCDEIEDEAVFLAQKSIIGKCNTRGKPVVCASQLMESMVARPRPTRPDFCDVANAILDGADCILLHHETTRGNYPVQVVLQAAKICKQAESAVWQHQLVTDLSNKVMPPIINIHAIANAAAVVSFQLLSSAIVVVSTSLLSAEILTQYRPKCPVIAVTRNVKKARQAHMFRGILPLIYKTERAVDWEVDSNSRVHYGINFGRRKGFIRPGDCVVIMMCSKQGSGFTDKMRVSFVAKQSSHGHECICDF